MKEMATPVDFCLPLNAFVSYVQYGELPQLCSMKVFPTYLKIDFLDNWMFF